MSEERGLKLKSGGVLNSEVFLEASAEELRVLIAVMENPFKYKSADEVARVAGVSHSRALSAITLFLAEGLFVREGDVSYEFEDSSDVNAPIERSSLEVAENIRKKELADLFSELMRMMKKDSFNHNETKLINSFIEDDGLSEEYIITLAAYIAEKKTLTVKNLAQELGYRLKDEIYTVEGLNQYIKSQEGRDLSLEAEFKATFNRRSIPTKKELDLYRKWTEVYGFLPEIILFAQEINILAGNNYSYVYMDTLLTKWHESGCKSLDDCKKQNELFRAQIAKEKKLENTRAMSPSKSKAPTPTYGDFDPSEAFERALARSYAKYSDGKDSEKKDG